MSHPVIQVVALPDYDPRSFFFIVLLDGRCIGSDFIDIDQSMLPIGCPSQIIERIDFVEVFDINLESRGGFIIDTNRIKLHEISTIY